MLANAAVEFVDDGSVPQFTLGFKNKSPARLPKSAAESASCLLVPATAAQ
jgi:hypothetical protein